MTTPVRERERIERPAPAGRGRTGRRVSTVVFLVAFVGAALTLARLGRQVTGGPAHLDVETAAGVPATLYLPVATNRHHFLPDPPPVAARYPAIVLAHGFSSDRVLMSSLARSFAAHGYAVVDFDFRGHGQNRHRFDFGSSARLWTDFASVVDWAQQSTFIDPGRIAVMGQSMGGGA